MPSDFGALEERIAHTESQVADVKSTVNELRQRQADQGTVLQQVLTAVTKQEAQPRFDPARAIDAVHKTVSILMMLIVPVAGVLIWMIIKTTAADFATAQVRMNEVIMPEMQRMRDKQDELVRRFVWRSGTTVEGAK